MFLELFQYFKLQIYAIFLIIIMNTFRVAYNYHSIKRHHIWQRPPTSTSIVLHQVTVIECTLPPKAMIVIMATKRGLLIYSPTPTLNRKRKKKIQLVPYDSAPKFSFFISTIIKIPIFFSWIGANHGKSFFLFFLLLFNSYLYTILRSLFIIFREKSYLTIRFLSNLNLVLKFLISRI